MRLEAQAKAGFYPTPAEVVEIIKTWIGERIAWSHGGFSILVAGRESRQPE